MKRSTNRFEVFLSKYAGNSEQELTTKEQEYLDKITPILEKLQEKYPDGVPVKPPEDQSDVAEVPEITSLSDLMREHDPEEDSEKFKEDIAVSKPPEIGGIENGGPMNGVGSITSNLIRNLNLAIRKG
jgi:hypothetical protein